jgi:hypothetical protein
MAEHHPPPLTRAHSLSALHLDSLTRAKYGGLEVQWVNGLGVSPGRRGPRRTAIQRCSPSLLIDCEEDRVLRAVLVGMLREMERR